MSEPVILKPHTCSTCSLKERDPNGGIICRSGPPSSTAIVVPGPQGQPMIIGQTTSFPQPKGEDWCWDHPDLIRPRKSAIIQN